MITYTNCGCSYVTGEEVCPIHKNTIPHPSQIQLLRAALAEKEKECERYHKALLTISVLIPDAAMKDAVFIAKQALEGEMSELPEVAGRHIEGSLEALERRAKFYIAEQQEKPSPDNALIALFCDTIRLCREYADTVENRPLLDSSPTEFEAVRKCVCKDGMVLGNFVGAEGDMECHPTLCDVCHGTGEIVRLLTQKEVMGIFAGMLCGEISMDADFGGGARLKNLIVTLPSGERVRMKK